MAAPDPLAAARDLLAAGDHRGAARAAQGVVRLMPDSFSARVILARAHAALAVRAEPALRRLAEAEYAECLRLVPERLEAHQELIAAGLALGRRAELQAAYRDRWSRLPFAQECLLATEAPGPVFDWRGTVRSFVRQPLVVGLAVVAAAAIAWDFTRKPAPPPATAGPSLAALSDLSGAAVSLDDFRGKQVVVLDFWATWCGPCRLSMPLVEDVGRKYALRGVQLLAVNQGETAPAVSEFLGGRTDAPRVVLDQGQTWGRRFGVRGIPTIVVLDKEGAERARFVGYSSDLGDRLAAALDLVL